MYRYRLQLIMNKTFQDQWLDGYYFFGVKSSNIPSTIESALKRKLDIIHAAKGKQDLRVPPGNRFEHLEGKLKDWCLIQMNKPYSMLFQVDTGEAKRLYFDPNTYK